MTLINENIRNIVNEVPEHKNQNFITLASSPLDENRKTPWQHSIANPYNFTLRRIRLFLLSFDIQILY